jgi:hypothetical protein
MGQREPLSQTFIATFTRDDMQLQRCERSAKASVLESGLTQRARL